MRLKTPRIPALTDEEMTPEQREVLYKDNPKRVINIFRTLGHHPALLRRWNPFGSHVLFKTTLPARERELIILRTGVLCRSEYEFAQHTAIGKEAGLTDEEIERIKAGADAPGWSTLDKTLLRATDELVGDYFITDETWAALSAHYSRQQIMDLVFAVGQYVMVSMALNSFGVQLEDKIEVSFGPTARGDKRN
ncbi:MAG: carboxymuconolactone decarboxylase family protein [Caulobacterales bacterium]